MGDVRRVPLPDDGEGTRLAARVASRAGTDESERGVSVVRDWMGFCACVFVPERRFQA